jgi:hypothetical protein
MTDTLRASAVLEPATIAAGEDFVVHVTISNTSAAPIRLNCLFLGYATLMLRITDLDGNPVPPGPPPLPPRDDGEIGRSLLAPGESFTIDYHGGNYSPQRLAPGRYWVRFRHTSVDRGGGDWTGVLASEWLGLEVRAP